MLIGCAQDDTGTDRLSSSWSKCDPETYSVGCFAGAGGFRGAGACNFSIGLGTAVAVELPNVAHFLDFVEIKVGGKEFVLVAAGLSNNFSARIAKVALAVEFANLPGMFGADAVDGSDKIGVGDGVSGLLELPEIFGEACDRGGGVVNNFRAVEAEAARAFREVAVVTNVHTDAGVASIENGITGVSWREIELFPETGMAMGDVVLAVFAQITSVGVNHGGGVVINAGHFDFVDGNDEDHLIFFRKFLHQADSGAVGDALSKFIPAGFLLGTKIRAVKKFLKAEDLYFFLSGGGNEAFVLGNHFLFYVGKRMFFRRPLTVSLNQAATNDAGH